ncbi:MAG: septum site-determining protein MinC [Zoogloeaceae bacterium]|jgi:septum site-determining protein MinC|nr:septum site-determining protein MinC [Zoogloeaceae bacterium]
MKKNSSARLIEFKGSTLPAIVVTLRSLDSARLLEAASGLFDGSSSDFFDGDAGLLNLGQLPAEAADPVDWQAIITCFSRYGLNTIGVRGGSPALRASAKSAGLILFPADERHAAHATEIVASRAGTDASPALDSAVVPVAESASNAPVVHRAKVVDRPLRSGQQVYARGGDLVVLASVNPGAEVIADGSIHIYAPLRGRALAGAAGDSQARIFTTCFEAELVSIAGIYRTFAGGVPAELAKRPVQVKADAEHLLLEPLKLD